MIVQFSVGNFLSFKDPVTFSMVASAIREHKETNLINTKQNLRLLKSGVIYGANSSGKSNLLHAIGFMRSVVRNSSKESQVGEEIPGVEPFLLNTVTTDEPSFFEMVFLIDDFMYRYGFEVDKIEVKSEWLYVTNKGGKEKELFYREKENFEISNLFFEGKELDKRTRNNALFLSVVANFRGEISTDILKWFSSLNVLSGLEDTTFSYTKRKLKDEHFKNEMLEMLNQIDLGIESIELGEEKPIPSEIQMVAKQLSSIMGKEANIQVTDKNLTTFHKKFDNNNKFVELEEFNLEKHESEGTKKIISLLGPIIDTLKTGKILVVDELDAKLHPILTKFLIKLFHSKYNSNNSQLIFNSHDTNLLTREIFRRDQIWFAEKDTYGATDLYSLIDYKVRNDASYEKDYLHGKYGSIPYIGEFEFYDKEG